MKGQKKIRLKLHNFYNRWFLVNHIVKNGFTLEMRTIYEEVNASETFWPRQEGNDGFVAEAPAGHGAISQGTICWGPFLQCKRSLLCFISFIYPSGAKMGKQD